MFDGFLFDTNRTLVMGILNVTPDSFSDGGRWATPHQAIERGQQMIADGADIIDIGGESTRPGAALISAAAELDRVIPVVKALAGHVVVSIDTTKAEVASRALDAGARIVNDVTGGDGDPDMAKLVVASGAPYICMYNTGPAVIKDAAPQRAPEQQVRDGLAARLAELLAAGVRREQIILDPGLGFAFAGEPNWKVLGHLADLASLGQPILIGASRKRFLGALPLSSFCGPARGAQNPPRGAQGDAGTDHRDGAIGRRPQKDGMADRDGATIATTALAAATGVWAVRVHDVLGNVAAVRVAAAWRDGKSS